MAQRSAVQSFRAGWLGLEITGSAAVEWMAIAQAFVGPPDPGRKPA